MGLAGSKRNGEVEQRVPPKRNGEVAELSTSGVTFAIDSTCLLCRADLTERRRGSQFCSSACRQAAYRRRRVAVKPALCPARVAALYIDPRGPYPKMSDVDCWDADRDATTYTGPHPIIAHPPCAGWGSLAHFAAPDQRRDALAVLAVAQVRRWGGCLEHPQHSKLWAAADVPRPGELPDAWGGWTIDVNQVAWGHLAVKPTRLYFVGVPRLSVQPLTGGTPTHVVGGGKWRAKKGEAPRKVCSAQQRRRTPPAFARWLVDIAATARMS
jgi:hypothetical protein